MVLLATRYWYGRTLYLESRYPDVTSVSLSSSYYEFWVVNRKLVRCSTSTDYQKKLQLFRYMVPQNLSCHNGDSTMIDFVRFFLLRHHVCELLDDTNNHVCESRSWNFRVLNIWRLNPPPFLLKICCFIFVDEYYYHCWRVVPVLFESNPTSLDPGSIGVVGS